MSKLLLPLTIAALAWPAAAVAHRHHHAKAHHASHHLRAHKSDTEEDGLPPSGIEWEGTPPTEAELDAIWDQGEREEALGS